MKRICTEEEKNVLYKNRHCILYDTFDKQHGNNISIILLGAFIGIIAGIFLALYLDTPSSIEFILLLCIMLSIIILQLISKFIGGTKDKRNVFKKYDIEINGATVVSINPKENCFIYIEDDYYDVNGKLAKLYSPLHFYKNLTVGMRIMTIRSSDNSYFLMALNEQTQNLIPLYTSINLFDPSSYHLISARTLPHPNAVYMDVNPHALAPNEKEGILNKYYPSDTKFYVTMALVLEFIIVAVFALIFLCLTSSDIISAQKDYLLFFILAIPINILLTYLYLKQIKKVRTRIRNNDIYVQRVLLIEFSYQFVGYAPINNIVVYEYKDQALTKQTYANTLSAKSTSYGSIIYKYTIGKNVIFSNKLY